jgi:hypothetical protein
MNITVKLLDIEMPLSRIKVSIKCKSYFPSEVFAYVKETSRFYYCTFNANVQDTCKYVKEWVNKQVYEYM